MKLLMCENQYHLQCNGVMAISANENMAMAAAQWHQ